MPRYLGSMSPPELLELLPPTDLEYSVKTVPALELAQQDRQGPQPPQGQNQTTQRPSFSRRATGFKWEQ